MIAGIKKAISVAVILSGCLLLGVVGCSSGATPSNGVTGGAAGSDAAGATGAPGAAGGSGAGGTTGNPGGAGGSGEAGKMNGAGAGGVGGGGASAGGGSGQGGAAGGSAGASGGSAGSNGVTEAVHFYGRWNQMADRAITVNTGSHVVAQFSGTGVSARFDVSANQSPNPTLAWRIDQGDWQEGEVAADVALGSGLAAGTHEVLLMVRGFNEFQSRWVPPLISSITFLGFGVTGGAVQPTTPSGALEN